MKEKLIIHTHLIRKPSPPELSASACAVEKAVPVSHETFQNLREHPLRDNPIIQEYADIMMYCDGIYHCLLIYDQEQGDGLLIESEGAFYARYAQYVPYAKAILAQYEQQNPEEQEEETSDDEESPGLKNIFG